MKVLHRVSLINQLLVTLMVKWLTVERIHKSTCVGENLQKMMPVGENINTGLSGTLVTAPSGCGLGKGMTALLFYTVYPDVTFLLSVSCLIIITSCFVFLGCFGCYAFIHLFIYLF